MHHFDTSLSGSPIVRGVYPPIYVSDLKKSMQWYCSVLRYRVMTYNDEYATMELAPGLFCFMNKNAEKCGTGYSNMYIPDTAQAYHHLVEHGVEVSPLHEEEHTTWFTFKDPDGNEYSVSGGIFGIDHIDYRLKPEHQRVSKWGFTFVRMPQTHIIGLKVPTSEGEPTEEDFQAAMKRLEQATKELSQVKPGAFIVHQTTRYIEQIIERTYYVGQETTEAIMPIQDLIAFTVKEQEYAVFEYFHSNPNTREHMILDYFWSNRHFGHAIGDKGHVQALLFEFNRDNGIEVYCPLTARQNYTVTGSLCE